MTDQVQRRLFLHSETEKAVLVSRTCLAHEADRVGAWLPRSQINITDRSTVHRPTAGPVDDRTPVLGTALTFTAPGWLLESRKLTSDLELPAGLQCPHGEPLQPACPDCVREHNEATL